MKKRVIHDICDQNGAHTGNHDLISSTTAIYAMLYCVADSGGKSCQLHASKGLSFSQ